MEKSLSIGQAALYLGISIVTLRRWNKASKISSFRTFGNHRRFRMSDLLKITHPQSSRLQKERINKTLQLDSKQSNRNSLFNP